MKSRFFPPFILLTILLAACAPAPVLTDSSATATPASTVVQPTPTLAAPTVELSTEVTAPTALPVATSRGPHLEATDPTTVSLASGGLQFVEFFRFT